MTRIRRVLYATDLSPASRRAFAAALTIAKSMRAQLTILNVLPPMIPTVPDQYLDAGTMDRLEQQARDWSSRELAKLANHAARRGIKATTSIRTGDAVAQIVGAARRGRADLIVLGTHGRHGLPKFFLGSVAERVVSTALCPVLTVRGR